MLQGQHFSPVMTGSNLHSLALAFFSGYTSQAAPYLTAHPSQPQEHRGLSATDPNFKALWLSQRLANHGYM
jgi:hypothetical protein